MLFCKLLIIICLQVLPEDLYLPALLVCSNVVVLSAYAVSLRLSSNGHEPEACAAGLVHLI
nr:MAG TPA: hypothetical protein [Microviridae sp.]